MEVVFYLGLQCLGEHLPRSGSSDLVEVEQEFFAIALNVMYLGTPTTGKLPKIPFWDVE